MFKLMIQYNNKGEFIDTVYPPCEYARATALLTRYRKYWGGTHNYILVEVQEPAFDTPLAEMYGG